MAEKKRNTVRGLALDVLLKVEKNQTYSNLLLHSELQKSGLSDRDRSLLTMIVYGTIQRQNTLDFYLAPFLKKGLKKKDEWVRVLLRMSLYQSLFMDRIPQHAIINEAVTIAKTKGHKGLGGLVNGILRNVQREGVPDIEGAAHNEGEHLSLLYSTPQWMIEKWTVQYGADTAALMAEANLAPAPVAARVNAIKATVDDAIALLEEEGITASKGELSEDSIVINKGYLPESKVYRDGTVTIQDESSMLVARAVAPKRGERILDACAAPGGKTTHMAELMENTGEITALDLHPHKNKLIDEQARRLGITIISARALDARKAAEAAGGALFDRILADVPCSGYGVIRKKPDMKWTKTENDSDRLSKVQKEIVSAALPLLKEGGLFVYSTCTIDKEENKDKASWILNEFNELEWDPHFKEKMPESVRKYIPEHESQLQILPHYFNSDGFYIAAFTKTKTTSGGEADA